MPTQTGQAPGKVSMSGGWTWSIPAKASNPDLAFKFIETMQTRANAQKWYIANSGIAVRKDVASDPGYVKAQPGVELLHGPGREHALPPRVPGLSQGLDGHPGGHGGRDDG